MVVKKNGIHPLPKGRGLLPKEDKRSHKMTRVSKEAIDWVESQVILAIDRLIETHPSLGKTIKPD